jgi:hypothetical protein
MDMNKHVQRLILILLIGGLSVAGIVAQPAQNTQMKKSPDGLWKDIDEAPLLASPKIQQERQIVPDVYRTIRLDQKALKRRLAKAPKEFTEAAKTNQTVISLPMPDGTFAQFRIQETQVMSPELAQQSPGMKTYSGHGIDDPTATVRSDWSPTGFHATVLSTGETVYIDPYRKGDTKTYISYYKKNLKRDPNRRPY